MPGKSRREFLVEELSKHEQTLEDIMAVSVADEVFEQRVYLLTLPEEISSFLKKTYHDDDLGSGPPFIVWTKERIYFVTSHFVGMEYEGGDCIFKYEIGSLPRNPAPEVVQSRD